MAITKVVPSMFAVANGEIVSGVTVGNTTSIAALTFDESGVIVAASNVTVTVANTNITGTITNDQIAGVANTKIDGLITSDQIANVASDKIIGTLGGNFVMSTFTSSGTWDADTKKANGLKSVKVTVVGAGGVPAGPNFDYPIGIGGAGGASIEYIPVNSIPAPVTVTVGTIPSKTSSFGAFLSATGGGNASAPPSQAGIPGGGGTGSGGDINLTGGGGNIYVAARNGLGWYNYGATSTTGIVIVEEFY